MVSVAKKAISGLLWMFTSTVSLQGVSLLVNIVLARLLAPADFGAVALVLGMMGILQTFAEMGTSVAIVQKQIVTQSLKDSAFTSTLAITTCIVITLWAVSGAIAVFFNLPVLEALLKIAALSYLFRGLFALYRCLLLKDLLYKQISILDFSGYLVYASVAITLAFLGYGPFSMVYAQLAWALSLLILGMWRTGYIPKSLGSIKEMGELISFGFWVSFSRVLRNVAGQSDVFIIGKFINASALGSYNLAQRIVMTLPTTYTHIIDQVLLPIYSKWQNDPIQLEKGYWKALSYSAIVLLPPLCLIFTYADTIVRVILGQKWLNVIPLVQVLSIFGLARALGGGIFDAVVYATGRPKVVTALNIFRIIVLPVCVLVGCQWGIRGVAWGLAGFGIVERFFTQWLLKKCFGFSLIRYLTEITPALVSALVSTSIAGIILFAFGKNTLVLKIIAHAVSLLAWGIVYFICLRISAPEKLKFVWDLGAASLKKYFNKKNAFSSNDRTKKNI